MTANILLASAHPYLPQLIGGAQVNMHETALLLAARGQKVAVAAGLLPSGAIGLTARTKLKLFRRRAVRDDSEGYPIFRSWFAWEAAEEVVRRFRPDVVVAHSGLPANVGAAYRAAGVPVIIYFHNVEQDDLAGMDGFRADGWLANSQFTARTVRERYAIEAPVIVPLFKAERYRVSGRGDAITFINPHPHKGLDTAIAIARSCPQFAFLFVKAWTLGAEAKRALNDSVADLPNVTLLDPVGDMRTIYARTRLLLLPSRWEEAWGRVATEAQYSGIPVIGSRRGGIVEAIGPGGVLIDPDAHAAVWASTVTSLMTDASSYAAVSAAALEHSERAEIDPHRQIESFEQACTDVMVNAAAQQFS